MFLFRDKRRVCSTKYLAFHSMASSMRGKDRRRKGWRSKKDNTLIPQTKQRTTSNVFSMFDKTQIHELKEVFNLIDQNCDGFIDKDDLYETMQAFGEMSVTDEYLEQMINESPSYINLTMFFTLFGSKLNGTDPDEIFESAFRCLDEDGTGRIHVDMLKRLLTETGDKFSEDEITSMLENVKLDVDGCFDYVDFIKVIKWGRTE